MSTIEIVPWICREEWEFCRDNLFGEDLLMKKKAVEHLRIWKTKCSHLHLAVECTLIIMDTHLQGLQYSENENRVLNVMNLELMYSMALTKFVNFVTDSNVGYRSNTLQDSAKELGIPAWIIDIRHKAAHGSSAPSLPLLREAIDFCLKWLYDNYWTSGDFEDVCNFKEDSFNDVENCIDVFLTANKSKFNGYQLVSQISEEDRRKIFRYFCKTSEDEDYERFDNWSLDEVCKIVLKKLSRTIKKYPRKGELLVDKLLDELISYQTLNSKDELSKYSEKWSEIISVLCHSGSCYYLLRNLLNITAEEIEPTYRKKSAAIYFNEILKNILLSKDLPDQSNDVQTKKKRRSDFEKKKSANMLELKYPKLSDQDSSNLLKLALERPSDFMTIFLKNLMKIQEPAVNPSKIDKLIQLIGIYTGTMKLDQGTNESVDYSLKTILGDDYPSEPMSTDEPENAFCDIKTSEQFESTDLIETIEESGGIWKKCSSSWKWNETPFGILPWQEDFKPWLKLYQV